MKVMISQKIRIYPNKTTKKYLDECFNYSRYCYNKGLEIWNKMYEDDLSPDFRKVRNLYKQSYKEDWEIFYSPNILDNAINDLSKGFDLFFKKISKYPKFKSKHKARKSFTINRKNDSTIRIINNRLYLPKIKSGIRLSETINYNGIIKLCTISEKNNRYFASFTIETDMEEFYSNTLENYVGIDVNIRHFDISEKNHRYNFPLSKKEMKHYEDKIKFYQKSLSKKVKGSNKYNKTRAKLNNIYYRLTNIQEDWLHKFTTYICVNYKNICIEDLNVNGMLKNKHLSKAIHQSNFYKFKTYLRYKCDLYDNNLILADRFFPSTQKCCKCGYIKTKNNKMKLSDRRYICPKCKNEIDRDYNSAINLKLYAELMG